MAEESLSIDQAISRARAAHQTGDLAAAQGLYRAVLAAKPDHFDALHLMGVAMAQSGNPLGGEPLIARSLAVNPKSPAARNSHGNVLMELGRFADALVAYDAAIALKPDNPRTHFNRAAVCQEMGLLDQAFASYDKVLSLEPGRKEAWLGIGTLFLRRKYYADALAAYDRAIEIDPRFASAFDGRAQACRFLGRWEDALRAYEAYLELMTPPGRLQRHAIATGKHLFAFDCMPEIYQSENEIDETRERLVSHLDAATREAAVLNEIPVSVLNTVFSTTGFFLAYQQRNDAPILKAYSALLQKLLRPRNDAPRPSPGGKIRFGVASELLRNNNASRWAYHWLSQLPGEDYEFFAYSLGATDHVTEKFASLGMLRQLPFQLHNFEGTIEIMRGDALDILMLTDIGICASSRVLSQYRIAPVQFTAWGHPETSGSPAIDYYLSGDLMEPDNAQSHYSEKLIRLPNLALYLEETAYRTDHGHDFGLPKDRVLYGCLQSLFKYLPQYDFVLPRIAKAVPNALFVFIEGDTPTMSVAFKARIAAAFAREGLDASEYVLYLPTMSAERFTALFRHIDLNMDSIGWTGGNTTVQALQMECPTVTLPGALMRGRHSYAMLKMIGVESLIASSIEDYIGKLVGLGSNPEARAQAKRAIAENKHRLYRDRTFIAALDSFLKSAAAKNGTPSQPQR